MNGANEANDTLSGLVLEVLPTLMEEGRFDEVLAAVAALVKRNEKLERQLAEFLERRKSKPNEGVSSDQLLLFMKQLQGQAMGDGADNAPPSTPELEEANARLEARAEASAERARQKVLAAGFVPKHKPLKKPLPAPLHRLENVIEVPEDERACPTCSKERTVIGYDVSEVLELEPAKLHVRRDKREKRACKGCDAYLVRAPRGEKVVAGGQIGCSIVANVMNDKYWMGLPLHRQRKNFRRMGLALSSSTLCDQVAWGARVLEPLWLEAIDQMFEAHVMHIDGSGVPVLDRDHPKGRRLGTLWATVGASERGPQVAAYFYASTKKAKGQRPHEKGPWEILAQRTGIVVSDADTLFVEQRKRDELIDCGCNMHARRYFVKALDRGDSRAALALGAFKGLYQVEEEFRDAGAEERLVARTQRSTPIYEDLVAWCRAHQPEVRPSEPLGRAVAYLLKHELALRRFETDGAIPMDNIAAEHAFVAVALTRKNYLFFGADTGGDRAAIAYTILHCCHLARVDPVAYLTDVLTILGRGTAGVDMAELMPARWKLRADSS
ncbi:MAG: IS66 family transposase [bacterium]|nr:IS66 family transposase [bacterium]